MCEGMRERREIVHLSVFVCLCVYVCGAGVMGFHK